jgi:hypothetical protein
MKLNIVVALIAQLFMEIWASAQVTNTGIMDTTGGERINNLSIGGYIDSYFGYNFNQPEDGNNPYFVSMNRHNEATINLAFIDLRYSSERVRARFVPGFGTYMNANYAQEAGLMKNFVEASSGYKVFARKDVWIDFGILGSPYTNESAIKMDKEKKRITLVLKIDTNFCPIMEYFEIFTDRMVFCRTAAQFLGYNFGLIINKFRLL